MNLGQCLKLFDGIGSVAGLHFGYWLKKEKGRSVVF